MCDYSLEMYRRIPARQGATYETHRFRSGSIGFIAADDPETAVCMACDTRLMLHDIPEPIQDAHHIKADEEVTFIRLESQTYRDGVRFSNDRQLSLQQLGTGVTADVIDALTAEHQPQIPSPAEAL